MKEKQRPSYLVQLLVHVVFVVSQENHAYDLFYNLYLFYQAMNDFQYVMPKEDRMRQLKEALIKGNGMDE